jgi:hypothetical protein
MAKDRSAEILANNNKAILQLMTLKAALQRSDRHQKVAAGLASTARSGSKSTEQTALSDIDKANKIS